MVSQCRGGPAGFGVGLLTLAVPLSYPQPSLTQPGPAKMVALINILLSGQLFTEGRVRS